MSEELRMYLKSLREEDMELLNRVQKTYEESFPPEERREFYLIKDLLSRESLFKLYAFMHGEDYIGFISTWDFDSFTYVEHFAIDPQARNGGKGAKAMQLLMDTVGKPFVLEVEMPTDEMSTRRIGFYNRLGFVLQNEEYSQPPYRKGDEWLEMRLMTNGGSLPLGFDSVRDTIHANVYGIKKGEVI